MSIRTDYLRDPEYLPFRLDLAVDRVLFVRLDAQQRREAAFLDPRALPPQPQGAWVPLSMLEAPATGDVVADGIFHIGHCGSTLLSRLLDSWPEVEGLREPLPLRDLAAAWRTTAPPRDLLATLMAYWRRPLPPASRIAIKLTSSCNVLADPLLRDGTLHRAILLDMPLASWLATLLKSEDSVRDALAAFDERAAVLRGHGITIDSEHAPRDAIEACAMGWLAERMRFEALASGEFASRVLRVDFEDLLAAARWPRPPGAATRRRSSTATAVTTAPTTSHSRSSASARRSHGAWHGWIVRWRSATRTTSPRPSTRMPDRKHRH